MGGELWLQVLLAVLVMFAGVVAFAVQQIVSRQNREQHAMQHLERLVSEFVVASEKRLTRVETILEVRASREGP